MIKRKKNLDKKKMMKVLFQMEQWKVLFIIIRQIRKLGRNHQQEERELSLRKKVILNVDMILILNFIKRNKF